MYECHFSFYVAAIYKCVCKVSPIHSINIYLTSNVCWEVESQGKQRGGKWVGRYEEEKEGEERKHTDKETKENKRHHQSKAKRGAFFFFFYRSHLLLPRKKVVYRTMVIYCQMANQRQRKNKNIPVIPPQNKVNRQIHSNTMIIYFLDKTSAISLFLTISE